MSSFYEDTELMHAFGQNWKNHKYIKKIGDRYFYTMQELQAYGKKAAKTAKSTYNKARRTVEDKTGVTAKKQSESYSAKANAYNLKAESSRRKVEKTAATAKKQYQDEQTYRNNTKTIRDQVQNSQDYKTAKMLRERESAAKEKQSQYSKVGSKAADRVAENYKNQKDLYAKGAKNYEDKYRSKLDTADDQQARAALTKSAREDFTAKEYTKNAKAYAEALKEYNKAKEMAKKYQDEYNSSFAGKLEKARNDADKAFDDVKAKAQALMTSGKSSLNSAVQSANTKIENIIDKADDSIAAGLGWVNSIFKKK